jgi:hypothetical protein
MESGATGGEGRQTEHTLHRYFSFPFHGGSTGHRCMVGVGIARVNDEIVELTAGDENQRAAIC